MHGTQTIDTHTQSRLQLTTRGRYAVIAMIEIAALSYDQPAALSDVARQSQVSLSYLEQLFAGLKKHKLVKSYRGPGGGYVLAKDPADISIAAIMRAAEDSTPARRESVSTTGVLDENHPCNHLFAMIETVLHDRLVTITLDDVTRGRLTGNNTA